MKFSRRKFIYTNTLLFGGWMLADSMPRGAANAVSRPGKKKTDSFVLAFCGDSKQFGFYNSILEGTLTGKFVHIKPRSIRSLKPNAVWLGKNLKHKDAVAVRCLSHGMHILVEPPLASDLNLFDQMQLQSNLKNTRIGLAHFHHYSPSSEKTSKILASGSLGQLNSVQIQLNDASVDPLMQGFPNTYIGNGMHLIGLVRDILGLNPRSVSAGPDKSASADAEAGQLALMMTLDGVPLSYTNIRDHFDKSEGWSVYFYGDSGQMRLCANNRLDILENNVWKTLMPRRIADKPLEIRLLVEDFIQSCMTGKEPEPNSSDALLGIILDQKAIISAKTEQTIQLFS